MLITATHIWIICINTAGRTQINYSDLRRSNSVGINRAYLRRLWDGQRSVNDLIHFTTLAGCPPLQLRLQHNAHNALFTPPVRHDKTVLSVSGGVNWVSRSKQFEQSAAWRLVKEFIGLVISSALSTPQHVHIFVAAYNVAACGRSSG